jgi:VWFA-related protein
MSRTSTTVQSFLFTLIAITLAGHVGRQAAIAVTPQIQEQRGGTASARIQNDDDEVLRVDTDLVPVDVVVTDAEGRPIKNLLPGDFRIFEDGMERPIAFFNVEKRGGETRPVSIVFALDISGSMSPEELSKVRSAVSIFVERLGSQNASFAVMSFGISAKLLQGFTRDRQKLERAFDKLAREENGLSTHTYDAVDDAIRLLVKKAPRTRERRLIKRAVVVVTDGFPVGDTVAPATVIERANAADIAIYTVTLPSFSRMIASAERAPLPTPLDVSGLAEKTGGRNVYATDTDFAPVFRAIAEEVVSTYVVAFYPPDENKRDGRFHSIRVEGPRGLFLRQSRPGYKSKER